MFIELHRKEISRIMRSSYLRGLNMASFFVASKIIIFMTVCVYVLMGNQLSSSRVFLAIALYGAVRLTITLFFPFAIEKISESLISTQRIQVNTARCSNSMWVDFYLIETDCLLKFLIVMLLRNFFFWMKLRLSISDFL